jgi:hypothetical protein
MQQFAIWSKKSICESTGWHQTCYGCADKRSTLEEGSLIWARIEQEVRHWGMALCARREAGRDGMEH